ncbi:MAG: hypothetical protein LiPW39_106 [Parcubacteria group bacterium LiPW_39]|nr:MAG: hypothetical protein LiPW39_106 [Parcubacteria group bacterium LiPW_39]
MLFLISLISGLIVLFAATIFLGAVFYHLFQYQVPNQSPKKPILIIAAISLIFIVAGLWIFSGVPWEML